MNHWEKIERPRLLENGHVTYFTLAAIDVEKNRTRNDNHGSKVIVVPFDGEKLDQDLQAPAAGVPAPARAGGSREQPK